MADSSELFSQLDGALKSEDHQSALEVCDQILAAEPGDLDALHSKVVCLVELGSTAEALQLIGAHPDKLSAACAFERAYCLYNVYREGEALQLIMPNGAEPQSSRELQLAGQIMYRTGDASRAAALFQKSEEVGGASSELSTNILAALVAAGKGDEALEYAQTTGAVDDGSSSSRGGEGTQFELFYNHACAAIAVGQLGLAKRLLGRAIEVCRDDCSDLAEEEIEVELGVLTAQSAFVDQTLGDVPSAEKAYQTLFAFKAELEQHVTAVAANNMMKIRGQRDFFDSWKRCKTNLSDALAKKLTPAQRLAFLSNGALLALHMNKPDQCNELLASIRSEFPSSEYPALMHAALLLRARQPKQCEEALEAAAASSAKPTAALLTLAQLHIDSKEVKKAISTLSRVTELKQSPGMVGTLVALHERVGDIDAASAVFAAGSGATDPALQRAAAAFYVKHGRWQQAAGAHEAILAANSRDLEALAGVVIATSHYDPALANEHYARLEVLCPPPDESEAAMIDAEELETAALPKTTLNTRGGLAEERKRGAARDAAADDERRPKKRKRTKRILYPKGFDPANPGPPPDPERWVPKRERSTYRLRKKDKRAGISRGPQGSATGAARVDAKATTNIQVLSDADKAKKKAEEEAQARKEAAAEAAAASSARKKGGKKGKGKW